MPIKCLHAVCIISIGFSACSISYAQMKETGQKGVVHDPKGIISDQLSSSDETEFKAGLEAAKKMAATHKPDVHFVESLDAWMQGLYRSQKYDALDQLVISTMIGRANDLLTLERYQMYRVRIQLSAGKLDNALASAKALYNVCSMASTNDAIDAVCECLVMIHPNGDSDKYVAPFRLQQLQGSSADTQDPTVTPVTGAANSETPLPPLLSQIKCDPAPFKAGLAALELNGKGVDRLIAEGNLLLLMDEPQLAEKSFRSAYGIKSQADPHVAIEGIARAMRAEDGNVRRANTWISSLQAAATLPQ